MVQIFCAICFFCCFIYLLLLFNIKTPQVTIMDILHEQITNILCNIQYFCGLVYNYNFHHCLIQLAEAANGKTSSSPLV